MKPLVFLRRDWEMINRILRVGFSQQLKGFIPSLTQEEALIRIDPKHHFGTSID